MRHFDAYSGVNPIFILNSKNFKNTNMAEENKKEFPFLLIGTSIVYLFVTCFAVYLELASKGRFPFEKMAFLALLSSIIAIAAIFNMKNDDGGEDASGDKLIQKRATAFVIHIIIWLAIMYLPFESYPKLSFLAILLFAGAAAMNMAANSKEARDKELKDDFNKSRGKLNKFAVIIIVLMIILKLVSSLKADEYLKKQFKNFTSETTAISEKQENVTLEDFLNSGDESNESKIAKVTNYTSPLSFNVRCPFKTTVTGSIDLTTQDNAVNITILFKSSGNIEINNGIVEEADEYGGKVIGTWSQPKSGLSGDYIMLVSKQYATITLFSCNLPIAKIELIDPSN